MIEAGMRVSIFWKGMNIWYPAQVIQEDKKRPGYWHLHYDDGLEETRIFKAYKWRSQ
ncbi:tudor domain-containing protein [Patescibacteria group bacterium]|nr:tudor domain-containing protein [Patescibacteria group bacterium]